VRLLFGVGSLACGERARGCSESTPRPLGAHRAGRGCPARCGHRSTSNRSPDRGVRGSRLEPRSR
jgi:hypothetical protein